MKKHRECNSHIRLLKKLLRIMKLTSFLILAFVFSVNASVYSQSTKLSINVKNGTLIEALKQIESQSEFYFYYNNDEVKALDGVSISVDKKEIQEVLDKLLNGTNLEYKIIDRYIALKQKNGTGAETTIQQQRSITGKVTDSSGNPLPGVTVVVKGTSNGTITDVDGNYSITRVTENSNLQFSFVGMKTQEVAVGNKTTINISLEEETIGIDEVVAIGYGVQKKSDVTGAISQIKSEDMVNRSTLRSEQALQGKTAGVQVVNPSGAPGKGGTVRVRGISSNNASEPLYVVDGLIVPSIGNIDPNSIESMEILKDGASAAIYGVASGNGVVIVTTKKGKAGQGKISYDFQYMTSKLPTHPAVLNSNEYINYMTEGNFLTQKTIDAYWDGKTNTNWFDASFETGITQRHNLSFQGGTDKSSLYLAVSYSDQNGIVKGDHDVFKNLGAVFNADYKMRDWLTVGTTNNLEKYETESVSEGSEYVGLLGSTLTMDPLTPVSYTVEKMPVYMSGILNGGAFKMLQDENGNYYAWSDVNIQDQTNPLITRDSQQNIDNVFNLNGTIYADLKPIKGLTVTSKLGYRLGYSSNYQYLSSFYGNSITNRQNLVVGRTNVTRTWYQWDNYATYMRDIGDHSINVMGGTSYIQPYSNSTGGTVNGIQKDVPLYRDIEFQTASAVKTVTGTENETGRLFSVFGRVNYSYKSKYLFQASVRRDAGDTNYFPKGNNIGIFPAVSLGWMVSEEDFFHSKLINYMKLRASWGQNGTYAHLNGFLWRASIATAGSYPYNESFVYQNASSPNRLQNPDLTWETTEQSNLGLDIRAFDSKLSLTAEWYVKNSKDLLVTITPPIETGQTAATINAGDVRNSGFEMELGWRDKIGDFTYGIQGNLATLKNKVTYLDPSISRIAGASMHTAQGLTVFEQGYPVWYMRGYNFEGVNPANGEPVFTDQLSVDTNGDKMPDKADGVINDQDKVMIGKGIPDLNYGLTLSAAYKGFDVQIFGAGQQGNQVYFAFTRGDRPNGNKLKHFYDDRWTASHTNASIPKPGAVGMNNFYQSSGVVFDGSYFKVKQIQLGYTIPSSILKKANISNVRIYTSLDDWFTFTKYIGYDPETSANAGSSLGVDKGNYPIAKKVLFGINVTF